MKINELKKKESELNNELKSIENETNNNLVLIKTQQASLLKYENQDIHLDSNIQSLKLQVHDLNARIDAIKRKIKQNSEINKPIEVKKLEIQYEELAQNSKTIMDLINEIHQEGVQQITEIQEKFCDEKDLLTKKYECYIQEKNKMQNHIQNIEIELNQIIQKLNDETKCFIRNSLPPQHEKIFLLKNESENLDNLLLSMNNQIKTIQNKVNENESFAQKIEKYISSKKIEINTLKDKVSQCLIKNQRKIQNLQNILDEQKKKNEIFIQNSHENLKNSINGISKYEKVDYISLFRTKRHELDIKYQELMQKEKQQLSKSQKMADKSEESIKFMEYSCSNLENSILEINSTIQKLKTKGDKIKTKCLKYDAMIKQARSALDELNKLDDASNNECINARTVHVQTFTPLIVKKLNNNIENINKGRELIKKLHNHKEEYKKLCLQEKQLLKQKDILQHENESLKSFLQSYPKIKNFFKKYCSNSFAKSISMPNKKVEILSKSKIDPSTSPHKFLIECNHININA